MGEGAFVVGGAGGKGGVFVHGRQVGEATLAQVSVGFQAGGKAFSEIIFFKDKSALDDFQVGSLRVRCGRERHGDHRLRRSGGRHYRRAIRRERREEGCGDAGRYYKGMAVFTIAKGGLMYQAAIAGQKFTYKPLGAS